MTYLKALTSLDGRYQASIEELQDIFSEYGLLKARTFVEIQWVKFLACELNLFPLSDEQIAQIDKIASNFDEAAAAQIKQIEKTTNHDVKAVEYYLKNKFDELGLTNIKEWIHFACTSEDINNTSYALMLKEGKAVLSSQYKTLLSRLEDLAQEHKTVPMMSRTHGQAATPTTVGKEFVNFAWRFKRELAIFDQIQVEAKMNGATGSLNAHVFAFPQIDWINASKKFLSDYLQVTPILYTIQINPNNYISEMMHALIRLSSTLIDCDRDMWGYISLGYFKQKLKEGEVGSSTMPHKVNPIDFENSEGNCGLAISLMQHLSTKLLISRFQRDLTDSTVLRNCGAVFGYILLSIKSALKGLNKIDLNAATIANDLDNNWELLAEPIQTIMRVYGEENPYEKLKQLTRGVKITQTELALFVDSLEKIPEDVKGRMKQLTPANYIGVATQLVDQYFNT